MKYDCYDMFEIKLFLEKYRFNSMTAINVTSSEPLKSFVEDGNYYQKILKAFQPKPYTLKIVS